MARTKTQRELAQVHDVLVHHQDLIMRELEILQEEGRGYSPQDFHRFIVGLRRAIGMDCMTPPRGSRSARYDGE